MNESPVGVRKATQDDLRFIASSWFESYWKGYARDNGMRFVEFQPAMDARIRRLLARSDTFVAFARAAPDEIVGYAALQDECAHWVYVKHAYRRQGVARSLLGKRITCYSHLPRTGSAGSKLLKGLNLSYNPFVMERE